MTTKYYTARVRHAYYACSWRRPGGGNWGHTWYASAVHHIPEGTIAIASACPSLRLAPNCNAVLHRVSLRGNIVADNIAGLIVS